MVTRVSASITIGGSLSRRHLADFARLIADEALSTEWDGEPFELAQLSSDASLTLMAHEVAWGAFQRLEAFCVREGLPFARWSGGYSGQFGAERVVFTGSGEPQSYAADEDDYILMGRCTALRLGSMEAIIAHFDAADFAVPPLIILAETS